MSDIQSATDKFGVSMGQISTTADRAFSDIEARTKTASTNIGKAGAEAGTNWGKGFRETAGAAGLTFLLAFQENIRKAMAMSEQLSTLHIETGESTDNLQRLQYAFASAGVEASRAQMSFALFQRQIAASQGGTGRSMLERIGLDPKQMNTASLTENIKAVADKIENLKTSALKTQVAMALFGRTGAQLLPVLNDGAAGLERWMKAANAGIINPQTLEDLHQLQTSLLQLSQITMATFANAAEPILGPLTELVKRLQDAMAWFSQLNQTVKNSVLFGAFVLAVKASEDALKGISSLFRNMAGRELITGLSQLIPVVNAIVDALMIFYAVWTSNFAGIQQAMYPVWEALKTGAANAEDAFRTMGKTIEATVVPAINRLGDALHPLLVQLGDFLAAVLQSKDGLTALESVFSTIATGAAAVIDAITSIVNGLGGMQTVVELLAVVLLPNMIGLLATGLVRALGLVADALFGVAAAEDVAFPPMLILQVIIAALILLQAHWRTVAQAFIDFGAHAVEVLRSVLEWMSNLYQRVADIIGQIPGLNSTADAVRGIGEAAHWAAEKLAEARDWLFQLEKKAAGPTDLGHNTSEADARNKEADDAAKWKPTPPTDTKPDTGGIAAIPKKGKAKKAGADTTIENINAALEPFKENIKTTDAYIKILQASFAGLPKADTAEKLAAQHKLLNEEIFRTNQLHKEQYDLLKAVEGQADKLRSKLAATHDPKKVKEYNTELKALNQEFLTGVTDWNASGIKAITLKEQQIDLELKHIQLVRQLNMESKNLFSDLEKKGLDWDKKLRDAQKLGPDIGGGQSAARNIADARDDITIAKIDETIATRKLKDEQAKLAEIVDKGSTEYQKQANAVAAAFGNLFDATQSVTLAQLKLANAQNAAADSVNASFKSMIDTLLGPFKDAVNVLIEAIANNTNPIQALWQLLISLFEKTKAFHDITVIVTRIFSALAQVLDALRPVIDLLLGVIIGVVNGFLMMANVIISIVNLFGAHIAKLKLVNTSLDDMTKSTGSATQLLQVTHDLPTINEYNQGHWADLTAKQDTTNQNLQTGNDILDQGFSQSLAKFGEMIGILISIHLAIEALAAVQALFGGKGVSGGIGGFFQAIGNWFHKSGSSGFTDVTGTVGAATALGKDATYTDVLGKISDNTATTADAAQTTADAVQGSGTSGGNSLASTVGKVGAGIGSIAAIVGGYKQGGVAGGISAGAGAFELAHLLLTGGAAAGPAGLIAAGVVGLGALLFGGNHDNPASMPDKYDTQRYGQDMADITGRAGANGQQFTENPQIAQALGGKSELQYMQDWAAANINNPDPKIAAKAAAFAAQFGMTGGAGVGGGEGGVIHGTDIGKVQVAGGSYSGTYVDLHDALGQAIDSVNQFAQAAATAAMDLKTVLAGAGNVDLGALFGVSTVSNVNGGFSVTPGGGRTTIGGLPGVVGGQGDVTVQVNVGNLHATDPNQMRELLTPVLAGVAQDMGRMIQDSRRSNQFMPGMEAM